MRLLWEDRAWDDYLFWQGQDKRLSKESTRCSKILKEILLMGLESQNH